MRLRGSVVTWAVVLMAAFSALSMICLFLLDRIVHGDLYGYGLQFSYNWATPYWIVKNIAFALGWLSIIAAIVVLYSVVFKRMEIDQLVLEAKKARARALKILKTESSVRSTNSAQRDRELPEHNLLFEKVKKTLRSISRAKTKKETLHTAKLETE